MRGGCGRFTRPHWGCRLFAAFVYFAVLVGCFTIGFAPLRTRCRVSRARLGSPAAPAIPIFPRLPRMVVGSTTRIYHRRRRIPDHAVFLPGGKDSRAELDKLRGYAKSLDLPSNGGGDKEYVPPISMMAIVGYTHTQAPLPPPTDPYKPNDNVVLSPFSAFWGGAITDNIGAFAQVLTMRPRRWIWRSVRSHLDVGQYRRSFCRDHEHRVS